MNFLLLLFGLCVAVWRKVTAFCSDHTPLLLIVAVFLAFAWFVKAIQPTGKLGKDCHDDATCNGALVCVGYRNCTTCPAYYKCQAPIDAPKVNP